MDNMSIGDLVCNVNYLSSYFLSYAVLVLVFSISLTIMLKKGNTLYTALPVASLYTSVLATLGFLMSCQSKTAVPFYLVIILWVLVGIFTSIRVGVK